IFANRFTTDIVIMEVLWCKPLDTHLIWRAYRSTKLRHTTASPRPRLVLKGQARPKCDSGAFRPLQELVDELGRLGGGPVRVAVGDGVDEPFVTDLVD